MHDPESRQAVAVLQLRKLQFSASSFATAMPIVPVPPISNAFISLFLSN